MVWCRLWRDHVLGPFFFNGTINGEKYLSMLQNDLIPQFHLLGDGRSTWFMQDGAPPHYATIVCDWLHKNFENWISRRGKVEWSPDLNPRDFYFWGDIKQIVYSTKIRDLDHLKSCIIDACVQIDGDADLLNRVYRNLNFVLTRA